MNKKRNLFILAGLLSLAIFCLTIISYVKADTTPPMPPVLGISPDQIQQLPQTPEELGNATAGYLKTQWGKIVSDIPGLLALHNFFSNHQLIFTILFNEKYNISWLFFFIVLSWLYTMAILGDITAAILKLKERFAFLFGIAFAIILSQLGIIKAIVSFTINIVSAQNLWWVRGILGFLILLVLFLIYYLGSYLSANLRASEKAQERESMKQEIKEGKAFRKGAEEGQEISEPLKKLRQKNPLTYR
jgi:hypothetical protein